MSTVELPKTLDYSQPELAVKFLDTSYAGAPTGSIEGLASTFDGPPDRVGDVVKKGAFGDQPFTVPLLAYHDAEKPVGSAVLTPSPEGLLLKATLANTPLAQEMRELVKAGAVPSLSIGYQTKASQPNEFGGEDLYAVEVMEVSLVPIPANPRAAILAAKSLVADTKAAGGFLGEQGPELRIAKGGEGVLSQAAVEAWRESIKAGRRNSNKDQGALDAAHDAIVTAGAYCPGEAATPDGTAAKDGPASSHDLDVAISILDLVAKSL